MLGQLAAYRCSRAEILPVGPCFAMCFKRTAPAVQRCKNQRRRRSYGRDRVGAFAGRRSCATRRARGAARRRARSSRLTICSGKRSRRTRKSSEATTSRRSSRAPSSATNRATSRSRTSRFRSRRPPVRIRRGSRRRRGDDATQTTAGAGRDGGPPPVHSARAPVQASDGDESHPGADERILRVVAARRAHGAVRLRQIYASRHDCRRQDRPLHGHCVRSPRGSSKKPGRGAAAAGNVDIPWRRVTPR